MRFQGFSAFAQGTKVGVCQSCRFRFVSIGSELDASFGHPATVRRSSVVVGLRAVTVPLSLGPERVLEIARVVEIPGVPATPICKFDV